MQSQRTKPPGDTEVRDLIRLLAQRDDIRQELANLQIMMLEADRGPDDFGGQEALDEAVRNQVEVIATMLDED